MLMFAALAFYDLRRTRRDWLHWAGVVLVITNGLLAAAYLAWACVDVS